jgi:hypothetical protein
VKSIGLHPRVQTDTGRYGVVSQAGVLPWSRLFVPPVWIRRCWRGGADRRLVMIRQGDHRSRGRARIRWRLSGRCRTAAGRACRVRGGGFGPDGVAHDRRAGRRCPASVEVYRHRACR